MGVRETEKDFEGTAYDPELDKDRLNKQSRRIYDLMIDGGWRTLKEIAAVTAAPEASASACLRDFRKDKWHNHRVEKRRRGEPKSGLWEYRVLPPEPQTPFKPGYTPCLF